MPVGYSNLCDRATYIYLRFRSREKDEVRVSQGDCKRPRLTGMALVCPVSSRVDTECSSTPFRRVLTLGVLLCIIELESRYAVLNDRENGVDVLQRTSSGASANGGAIALFCSSVTRLRYTNHQNKC